MCGHVFSETELSKVHKYEDDIGISLESLELEKKVQGTGLT